jgi:hypothetical protein
MYVLSIFGATLSLLLIIVLIASSSCATSLVYDALAQPLVSGQTQKTDYAYSLEVHHIAFSDMVAVACHGYFFGSPILACIVV